MRVQGWSIPECQNVRVSYDDRNHRQSSDSVEESDFFGRRDSTRKNSLWVREARERTKDWPLISFLESARDVINCAQRHQEQNGWEENSVRKETRFNRWQLSYRFSYRWVINCFLIPIATLTWRKWKERAMTRTSAAWLNTTSFDRRMVKLWCSYWRSTFRQQFFWLDLGCKMLARKHRFPSLPQFLKKVLTSNQTLFKSSNLTHLRLGGMNFDVKPLRRLASNGIITVQCWPNISPTGDWWRMFRHWSKLPKSYRFPEKTPEGILPQASKIWSAQRSFCSKEFWTCANCWLHKSAGKLWRKENSKTSLRCARIDEMFRNKIKTFVFMFASSFKISTDSRMKFNEHFIWDI